MVEFLPAVQEVGGLNPSQDLSVSDVLLEYGDNLVKFLHSGDPDIRKQTASVW
jgi:hypothetical protein